MKFGYCLLANLLFLGFAAARIWVDDDTVIIDPLKQDDFPRFKREDAVVVEEADTKAEDEDTMSIRIAQCVTSKGLSGHCMSLRECYPILYPIDPDVELPRDVTLSDPLADQLIKASGFCSGGEYKSDSPSLFAQVVRSEVLVCCPAQSKIPAPLPKQNATAQNIVPSRSQCGVLRIDTATLPESEVDVNSSRVVQGREAKRGEFPWIVALMSDGKEFCGGSLIDKQNVLTAAHCVQHMDANSASKLTILIGDHDIYSTADGIHEVRTASRILYHRGFSMNHLHHDVALLQLSRPVSNTKFIQPVCLHPGTPSYDNVFADVAGWGQLRDGGPQPSKLQTASVKVWTHAECQKRYGSNAPAGIGEGMVCAGGSGKDSCRGDSGGPLTINSRSKAQIIGIVSFGIGCGSYPGVYTRVDKYLAWINKNSRKA